MQVSIDDAARRLSELIEVSRNGEEVAIIDGHDRVAMLIAVLRPKPFRYDILADQIRGPIPDSLEPMEEDELELWEGRGEGESRERFSSTHMSGFGRSFAATG